MSKIRLPPPEAINKLAASLNGIKRQQIKIPEMFEYVKQTRNNFRCSLAYVQTQTCQSAQAHHAHVQTT